MWYPHNENDFESSVSKIYQFEKKNADEPKVNKCVPKDKLMCHLIGTMNAN